VRSGPPWRRAFDDWNPHNQPHELVESVAAGPGRRLVLERTPDGDHIRYQLVFDSDVTVLVACFDLAVGTPLGEVGIPAEEVLEIGAGIAEAFGSSQSYN
jgi:hypothetical protein